jgi:NAD+ synthase
MTVPTTYLETVEALALADQISEWIKERFDEARADRFVLGLSGGIDSAVVAGLCARAAGPDRVLAVMMPSGSNPDDLACAQEVVEAFGLKSTTIDLTSIADSFYASVPDVSTVFSEVLGEGPDTGIEERARLARANVRPRLRMMTLYYLANLTRGIVVGTGNKTELMIGYFTKYGDGGVDIFPLTDLYKYEVRAVARAIGVPESVITRPPSAGLWEGQTDEEEIGLTYDELDSTLSTMETGDRSLVDPNVLARIQRMVSATAHKRAPVPSFSRKPH